MSSFKIIVDTRIDSEVIKALKPQNAIRGIQQGLTEIGKNLVKSAEDGIKNPPKTGRLYRIRGGRTHQASAPGQYPAEITGKLRRSLGSNVNNLIMEFGADTKYAPILQQFDTPLKTSSNFKKIAPRPFLTLSHNENKDEFIPIMNRVLRQNL